MKTQGETPELNLSDGERIVWSELQRVSALDLLRSPLLPSLVSVSLVPFVIGVPTALPWLTGLETLSPLRIAALVCATLGALLVAGALAHYFMGVAATRVTFTTDRVLRVGPGLTREARWADVASLIVRPDRIEVRSRKPDEARIVLLGLREPRRVAEDLLRAGVVLADQVEHQETPVLPGVKRAIALSLIGVVLVVLGFVVGGWLRGSLLELLVPIAGLLAGAALVTRNMLTVIQAWRIYETGPAA